MERPWSAANRRERERLRALVAGASPEDLARDAGAGLTVAGVLLHIAFWDQRQLWLVRRLASGVPFTPSEVEPEDPAWINDTAQRFLQELAPRDAAALALRIAEETDEAMESLEPARVWPADPESPVNPLRADHRGEHLDELEALLARRR